MPESVLGRLKHLLKGPSPINVGVITSLMGPLDYYGQMQIRGLELGIEYATQGSGTVNGRPIRLLVEPAAADSITDAHFNRYVFRTGANVSQDAAAGGKHAVEHLGRTFCFIAPDYIWGQQSKAAWKHVVGARRPNAQGVSSAPDTTDFTP